MENIKEKIKTIIEEYPFDTVIHQKDRLIIKLTSLFQSLSEQKEVYEKVMCDVELPDKTGLYNTVFGLYTFQHSLVKGNSYWEGTDNLLITYWLKPVTINQVKLPDLSEMYNKFYKEGESDLSKGKIYRQSIHYCALLKLLYEKKIITLNDIDKNK